MLIYGHQISDAMIALETVMAIPAAFGAPVEKPKAHKQTPASTMSVSPKRQIISIEEKKLEVLASLLDTQNELLSVERRRLAVEEEKLTLLKQMNTCPADFSPIIKFY
ncbi:uncharacterized protein LOC124262963 [Haliotis rubra]|uniref:uncharacterized protein LOC124262963 n=1 Tax=Haliotis rubra TaxID=36100 RepID=UPI001EE50243|nr:uncharacterized protein LOC124262963 [Haliotis rubra]XP_046553536.1 uncharacterized protein LOC124262963 [Haliotis rubra]